MLILVLLLTAQSRGEVVRRIDTADGLSHPHVRDIMQDSRGFIWFATWTGVDRFDGYEFRHYTTYPGDPVMLDNHRIERLAETPGGTIALCTYTGRVYGLDPSTGVIMAGTRADSMALDTSRPEWPLRPDLRDIAVDSPLSYVDRDGNLWIGRKDAGVDFVTASPRGFIRIDINSPGPGNGDIHALYADGVGRVWTASRDGRVRVLDSRGRYRYNLAADGRLVSDTAAMFGPAVYAFGSDASGRIWIGTKQGELYILTPHTDGRFAIERHGRSDSPGGLRCADVYAFATDIHGQMWLGTFGGGVARADVDSLGRVSFFFPDSYPVAAAGRVRRLTRTRDGMMVAATTGGVVVFTPDGTVLRHIACDHTSAGSLSNDDILDVFVDDDNVLYLSAFSGGIDYVDCDSLVRGAMAAFGHRNLRHGLPVDHVLAVTADASGDRWVVSTDALVRYDSLWRQTAIYDSHNIGTRVHFTESRPAVTDDSTLMFGLRGGVLMVRPRHIAPAATPSLVVTGIEYDGHSMELLPPMPLQLPRGVRELTVRYAALDFSGGAGIRYAYALDGDTVATGTARVAHISGLSSGRHELQLIHTDAFGTPAGTPVSIVIEVPRTPAEMAETALVILAAICVLGVIAVYIRRRMRHTAMRRRLDRYVMQALGPDDADASFMGRVACAVGATYTDDSLKAEAIARRLDMPRNDLRRRVKAAVGVSVEEYVRMVRVQAAARLLCAGSLTVSEVAYRCGFRTPQYMAMVFKEQTGLTPGEYAAGPGRHVSN